VFAIRFLMCNFPTNITIAISRQMSPIPTTFLLEYNTAFRNLAPSLSFFDIILSYIFCNIINYLFDNFTTQCQKIYSSADDY